MIQKRMFNELKFREPDKPKHPYLWWIILVALIIGTTFLLSSCSGSRHLTKTSSKSDSTVSVKTDSKIDSMVSTSSEKKVVETTDNDVSTKDDYVEETTYYYGKDSSNIPTITKKVTKRTGIQIITDKSKKKTELNVKDTTAINLQANKKEERKEEIKKEDSSKKVDSEHSILSRGNVIAIVSLLIIGFGLWAYKKFVK